MPRNLINESTSTIDIEGVELKLADLIYRIYTEPLIARIGAKIETSVPKGSIFSFSTYYDTDTQGQDKSNTPYGTVDDTFTGTAQEDTIKATVKHIIHKRLIDCKTRTIKSGWTPEALNDYIATFPKKDIEELLVKELLTEVIQEIDMTALKLLVQKGTPVSASVALNSNFAGAEIYAAIQEEGLKMISNIKRAITICATVDPKTAGKLMAHPNFVANTDFTNAYFLGSIGATEIYCDYYTSNTGNYAIITYKERAEKSADGSIVFSLYGYNMTKAIDSTTGENAYFHYTRYDVVQHPLDTTDDGQSKFIKVMNIINNGGGNGGGGGTNGPALDGGII